MSGYRLSIVGRCTEFLPFAILNMATPRSKKRPNAMYMEIVGDLLRAGRSGERIPVGEGGEIFCPHPDQPWGPPSLLYRGYCLFLEGKAVGVWC
jgi:hypothetical protein